MNLEIKSISSHYLGARGQLKRIKMLCIILLFIFFGSLYQDAILPFIEGLQFGFTTATYEKNHRFRTEDFLLMDVMTKDVNFMEESEINLLTNERVMIRPVNMTVMLQTLPEKPAWWGVSKVISFVFILMMLALGVWIPFLVVKVVRSLQQSAVFDRRNLIVINRIGIILLVFGILETLSQIINVASAQAMVDLMHYTFTYARVIDFNPLLMGIVVLIMNEILCVGTEMKEEQDLTI